MKGNTQLVSGAVVYKSGSHGDRWFVVQKEASDSWEIPKAIVRKGESSVRTSIRIMAELAGMRAKVLEEAGRSGGATAINGKTVPQRYLYYLMQEKAMGEVVGFAGHKWLDYSRAIEKLPSKRDRMMLRMARQVLRQWRKRPRVQ
ncbi:hypothetical protein HY008_00480 [Candidatus Woesebacteria bacterium]|nr:hypothetical protein [Candidatus Woesebacteria bacterium]